MSILPNYSHESVMLSEMLSFLQPQDGGSYCDATLGGGGYSLAILQASKQAKVIGIDRDPSAIRAAQDRLSPFQHRFTAIHGNFADIQAALALQNISTVDGIVADIGVSSPQIDQAGRGFSFQNAGPIDMRMNPQEGVSALDLIQTLSEEDLANVIFHYGEERFSRRIARSIKQSLEQGKLTDTKALAITIASAVPTKDSMPEKAMRTFQALRIAVNDELRQLDSLIKVAADLLTEGGRLVIVSFHSLEDRIVKQSFKQSSHLWEVLTKKPIYPCDEEIAKNPRSRSARLRAAKRVFRGGFDAT